MDIELAGRKAEELSYSRDLLQRFASTRSGEEFLPQHRKVEDAKDSGGVGMELSLGLSLGGCFEEDKMDTRLARSSSTAMIEVFPIEVDFALSSAPLIRACSLPVETEEEPLKRKEMQGLKLIEAKRKRLEKKSSSRPAEAEAEGYGDWKEHGFIAENNGRRGGGNEMEERTDHPEAIRSCSLGFNGRGLQGSEASFLNNSSIVPSMPEANQKPTAKAPLPPLLRSLKSLQEDDEAFNIMTGNSNGSENVGRNIMAEMPFVSTKGDGPNGRRVEGFLYKYRKGEEVRIVCVCHGNFHSPAEFIKHAGGGKVAHPLRHIVVNPSPPVYY